MALPSSSTRRAIRPSWNAPNRRKKWARVASTLEFVHSSLQSIAATARASAGLVKLGSR
jgi:hypothetical protein